ncbi:MAG: HigA family addiction module antidote protein [Zoogloeaceae bacterium]|jgi:addiction module HigA family antidote|nr:HigA family addiction module antidote protein [Zoogloeaceae bacterium]
MTNMHNPPHPGELLREDTLPALGISVTEAARQLGVSRVMLSRILHEKSAISADMALRLEAWLKTGSGGGPSAGMFLKMQADYDLWQAIQAQKKNRDRCPILPVASWAMGH